MGFYRWDSLRALGNSKLVQLTGVIPIVGYFILFNDSFDEYNKLIFDTEIVRSRLYYLYFGFCSLAAASLMFAWRCPAEVKEHGTAYDFVEKQAGIVHKDRVAAMITELAKATLIAKLPAYLSSFEKLYDEQTLPENAKQEEKLAQQVILNEKVRLSDQSDREIMRDYFVYLKSTRDESRIMISVLYFLGFALLAIPTVRTFLSVLGLAIQDLTTQ